MNTTKIIFVPTLRNIDDFRSVRDQLTQITVRETTWRRTLFLFGLSLVFAELANWLNALNGGYPDKCLLKKRENKRGRGSRLIKGGMSGIVSPLGRSDEVYQTRFTFHSNFLITRLFSNRRKLRGKRLKREEEKKTNTNKIEIIEIGTRKTESDYKYLYLVFTSYASDKEK